MKFKCFDGHTCGNPVRLVTNNHPDLKGERMSEKRIDFVQNHDHIRRGLMFEPRGHDMMSGSFIYPSNDEEVDFGILFIETSGCLPMCGHGTIGTVTLGLEHGIIKPKNEGSLRIEVPAGMIKVNYEMNAGKVDWVKIENVASFLHSEALIITDEYLGELQFDVSYGGNFYAIFDPQPNFKGLEHFSASDLIMHAKRIRAQINADYPNRFVHPEDASIHGVSHVLWTGTPSEGATARNAVFYGDKAI
ncbi:MAG: 4-hydroxyproline epimerase, partial [Flavobacteriaceae bacterium]